MSMNSLSFLLQMYSVVFRRSIYRLSTRVYSSSHTFPNEDLLFTVKSPQDHTRSGRTVEIHF